MSNHGHAFVANWHANTALLHETYNASQEHDACGQRAPGAGRPGHQGAGFDPEDLPEMFALEVTRWDTLKVSHRTQMTSLPGVFAAGDIVRGASLVVWAIRDGRDAAAAMHAYMQQAARQDAALAVAAE